MLKLDMDLAEGGFLLRVIGSRAGRGRGGSSQYLANLCQDSLPITVSRSIQGDKIRRSVQAPDSLDRQQTVQRLGSAAGLLPGIGFPDILRDTFG
ncbi:hypothetical protein D3C73_1387480 [compost metagenome]